MKSIECLAIALLTFLCTSVSAQIAPEPPVGTRWIVNNDFTDEFNGEELDTDKWYDFHPRWKGRQPAIFLPRQVSVAGGNMVIKNVKLDQDTTVVFFDGSTGTYSIGGGAVVSRKIEAYHGYYEVRMKASDISMSTTFWMSNPGTNGDCPNYSLELDIIETIGGAKNFPNFATKMKSNTHYFQTACDGTRRDFAQGGEGPIGGDSSDDFHTYGCWWEDENNMTFYIDGQESHTIRANTGGEVMPFNRPMHINMVTETYDWEQAPTDAELADDSRNTSYYDYIHSFEMLEVDTEEDTPGNGDGNLVVNSGFETGDFTGWTGWGGAPREVIMDDDAPSGDYVVHIVGAGAPEQIVTLEPNTDYVLGCKSRIASGQINFGVKPTTINENLGLIALDSTGWHQKEFTFNTGENSEVKFFFYAPSATDEGFADDFYLRRADGAMPEPEPMALLFEESFRFSNLPTIAAGDTEVDVRFLFKGNEPRDVVLRLLNADGQPLGSDILYQALPGYGHKEISIPLPAGIASGDLITLEGDLRPVDAADEDRIQLGRLIFNVGGTTTSNRNTAAEELRVFPNPTTDEITITGIRQATPYRLLAANGQEVGKGLIPAHGRLSVRDLKHGIYLIMMGDNTFVRFVKH